MGRGDGPEGAAGERTRPERKGSHEASVDLERRRPQRLCLVCPPTTRLFGRSSRTARSSLMSFSALARLWLRRTSQQLRAASSTSSSAGGPPPLPVGSAPPSPSTSSSPPPLPGVSTPLAAQAPPPLSVRPMPGIQARPNPPAAAKSTVKVVFEAPASTPPIKAVTLTSDKPWKGACLPRHLLCPARLDRLV